jgi:cation diffusion facilitator family transporter
MRVNDAIKTVYLGLSGNILLAVVKGVAGYYGNSFALIADSVESATDCVASILLLLGLKYALKPADKNHPYGHGRAEALTTFVVVGFLVASAAVIAYQSVQNIRSTQLAPEKFTLVVLASIVLLKEFFYRAVTKTNKKLNSSALKADAWHHRSDALTSLMAFIGISISVLFGEGYENAEDWAALAASFIILINAWRIFRPALGEIMDEHVHDNLVAQIRILAEEVDGVLGTEKCLIRKTGMRFHVDLHIIVNASISVLEGHNIAHAVKDHLINKLLQLSDVLIHVEPGTNISSAE